MRLARIPERLGQLRHAEWLGKDQRNIQPEAKEMIMFDREDVKMLVNLTTSMVLMLAVILIPLNDLCKLRHRTRHGEYPHGVQPKTEEMNPNAELLSVFLLGATSMADTWGPRQIIAAGTQEQALALARWDYNDGTEWCEEMAGVQATGEPRILFTHYGN